MRRWIVGDLMKVAVGIDTRKSGKEEKGRRGREESSGGRKTEDGEEEVESVEGGWSRVVPMRAN